jgi:hypothetical protein
LSICSGTAAKLTHKEETNMTGPILEVGELVRLDAVTTNNLPYRRSSSPESSAGGRGPWRRHRRVGCVKKRFMFLSVWRQTGHVKGVVSYLIKWMI